jgi:hypothetical protein
MESRTTAPAQRATAHTDMAHSPTCGLAGAWRRAVIFGFAEAERTSPNKSVGGAILSDFAAESGSLAERRVNTQAAANARKPSR